MSNGTPMITPLPDWVVLHVPHDSTRIPHDVRDQFVLDDAALEDELLAMTDHLTLDLFASGVAESNVVRAPVSRLVMDVERFEDDALEPMSARGMGAIYTRTSAGIPLRRRIDQEERTALLARWHRPHHDRLESVVAARLERFDRVLIVDAHSFPSVPLPYEPVQDRDRPEICIGTDAFHTPPELARRLVRSFEAAGFAVAVDTPFAGALVPILWYRKDRRVSSVRIEVRRDLNRRAALARGILQREMQSITWEAVRGLYPAGFKSQAKNVKGIASIWDAYQSGKKEPRSDTRCHPRRRRRNQRPELVRPQRPDRSWSIR